MDKDGESCYTEVVLLGRRLLREYDRSNPNMKTAKQEVARLLETIPDDSTFEDIQYHIYVREKIEHGLKDIREGRVLSQKEVEKRLSKWL